MSASSTSTALQGDQLENIASQLLIASVDAQGTYRPLREWLRKAADRKVTKLTDRDIGTMLRHFRIAHNAADLVDFLRDICRARPLSEDTSKAGIIPLDIESSMQVSPCDVMRYVQRLRGGNWTAQAPKVCSKIFKFISFTLNSDDASHLGEEYAIEHDSSSALRVARTVTAKLRAFSFDDFVDVDIFSQVVHASGLLLSREDCYALADATDVDPSGNRVKYSVVTEAVLDFSNRNKRGAAKGDRWLHVLRDKLNGAAESLKLQDKNWRVEMKSAFKGFDDENLGVISRDDFRLALHSLRVPDYEDVFRHMPAMDYVSYETVLEYVFSKRLMTSDRDISPSKKQDDKENDAANVIEKSDIPPNVIAFMKRVKKAVVEVVKSHDDDMIWGHLLEVFCSFDEQEQFWISSKEFSQAISILLKRDGGVVASSDLKDVCEHFVFGASAGQVDYMAFCEAMPTLDQGPVPLLSKPNKKDGRANTSKTRGEPARDGRTRDSARTKLATKSALQKSSLPSKQDRSQLSRSYS
jgi:hypothetical protein